MSEQEQFILNDIILRINPIDIQAFDQKFVERQTFIRENSTHAYSSKAALATYVATFAFDLNNAEDKQNLVSVCTELTKYPFIFVNSPRLNQFIPNVSKREDQYNMFAVKEWTIQVDQKAKRALFLTIEMHYFCHTPYVNDFRFLSYEGSSTIPKGRVTRSNAPAANFKLKVVENLYESQIFKDYFKYDIKQNTAKFNQVVELIGGKKELCIGMPLLMTATAENKDLPHRIMASNYVNTGFEDVDIKELSFVNNHKTNKDREDDINSFFMVYQDINILNLVDSVTGSDVFNVQQLSLTKRNNIVANQLQGYSTPFIQYMGKSPAEMKVVISINNSNVEYLEQDNIKPYEMLSVAIRRAEQLNTVSGSKLPFKSTRIRTILNVLADSNYFILDNETSFESSDDQGHQIVSLAFTESDLTDLIGNKNLKLATTTPFDNHLIPILKSLSILMKYYTRDILTGSGLVDNKYVDDIKSRQQAIEKTQSLLIRPPSNRELLVQKISETTLLDNEEAKYILETSLSQELNVGALFARVFLAIQKYAAFGQYQVVPSKSTYRKSFEQSKKTIDAIIAKIQSKSIDQETGNFKQLLGVIVDVMDQIVGLQEINGINKFDKDYSKYASKMLSKFSKPEFSGKFKEIKEEAIDDLAIFESLVKGFEPGGDAAVAYAGEKDGRKFSPFFFLVQDPYLDETSLFSLYQYIHNVTDADLQRIRRMEDRVETTMSTGYLEMAKPHGTFDNVKLGSADQNKMKSAKIGKAAITSANIEAAAEGAYQTWLKYKESHSKDPNVKQFDLTKEFLADIIRLESGGNQYAINEGKTGKNPHYGIFQVTSELITLSGGRISEWSNISTNTNAALHLWFSWSVPQLLSKRARAARLNPNSSFNFYMMHQQGPSGWMDVVEAYANSAKRNQYPTGAMRARFLSNTPGYDEKKRPFNGTINDWVTIWMNHYQKKTGKTPIIFGEVVTNQKDVAQNQISRLSLTPTPPISGIDTFMKLSLLKPELRSKAIYVEDGDTLTFKQEYDAIGDGGILFDEISNDIKIRTACIDSQETAHLRIARSPNGQPYSEVAKRTLMAIMKELKFPLYFYITGDKTYDRIPGFLVDSNGVDIGYEMVKAGLAVPLNLLTGDQKGKIPNDRFRLYKQAGDIARINKLGMYAALPDLASPQDAKDTKVGGFSGDTKLAISGFENPKSADDTTVSYDTVPKGISILDRSNALQELDVVPDELRPADGLLSEKSGLKFEGFETELINEFNEKHQAQYRCSRTGKYLAAGLDLSVPVVKVYLVEGLRDDWISRTTIVPPRETNLYEVGGISDIKIQTADENNPVAVMTLSISNPGSIYTDIASLSKQAQAQSDFTDNNLLPTYMDKIGKLTITGGTRLHVKMGYSNDPNELETVFNGEVVEVEGEAMLNIIAEGYGRELVAIDHSPQEVKKGGGLWNSSTSGIIAEILNSTEIFTFGVTYYMTNSKNPFARNILSGITATSVQSSQLEAEENEKLSFLGKVGAFFAKTFEDDDIEDRKEASDDFLFGDWWRKSSELYTNVYSPVIELVDSEFVRSRGEFFSIDNNIIVNNIGRLGSFYKGFSVNYPIYNTTPWEVLKEMQYRHPGTWSAVFNYKERATLFFGIKEQLYIATDPPIAFFGKSSESYQTVMKELEPERYKVFKPAADFHMITSEMNIISNQIRLNAGFKTQIDVRYFFDNPTQAEHFITNDTGIFTYYSMKLDDNLRPNSIRSMTLELNGCDHRSMAWRYGANELKKQMERMYDGKIVIVGNPNIKAGDYAYLSDSFRNLNGVIKVRECSHIMNEDDGYITVITPGLHVESSVYVYSNLFTKFGLAYTIAANKIKADAALNLTENKKLNYVSSMLGLITNHAYVGKLLADDPKADGTANRIKENAVAIATDPTSVIAGITLVLGRRLLLSAGGGLLKLGGVLAAEIGPFISGLALAANGARTASALGILANVIGRPGLLFAQIGAGILGAPAAAIGAAVVALTAVLIIAAADKIDEINEARQPLVFMPLMNNGLPYQAGVIGFELNSYTDSFWDNAKRNYETGKRIISNVYEAATDPDELSKSLTMLKQAKISLPSTFEL